MKLIIDILESIDTQPDQEELLSVLEAQRAPIVDPLKDPRDETTQRLINPGHDLKNVGENHGTPFQDGPWFRKMMFSETLQYFGVYSHVQVPRLCVFVGF